MHDLSVIVPCHNVEKYVGKCLGSILSQKNQHAASRELIVVLDSCSDGTESAVSRALDGSSAYDVKVVRTVAGCPGFARNDGYEASDGKYIWFIDSDDWLVRDDAVDIVYGRMVSDDLDFCHVNTVTEYAPDGFHGWGTAWMGMWSRRGIGDIRFNGLQNGEDNKFVDDVMSNPLLRKGDVELPLYYYNVGRVGNQTWVKNNGGFTVKEVFR